jgi:hypothetical protein
MLQHRRGKENVVARLLKIEQELNIKSPRCPIQLALAEAMHPKESKEFHWLADANEH